MRPAARFLAALAEHEIAERARRRIERHLAEARLLPAKSLDSFDFDAVPMLSKARVMAFVAGDSWLEKGDNFASPSAEVRGPAFPRRRPARSCIANPPIDSDDRRQFGSMSVGAAKNDAS